MIQLRLRLRLRLDLERWDRRQDQRQLQLQSFHQPPCCNALASEPAENRTGFEDQFPPTLPMLMVRIQTRLRPC